MLWRGYVERRLFISRSLCLFSLVLANHYCFPGCEGGMLSFIYYIEMVCSPRNGCKCWYFFLRVPTGMAYIFCLLGECPTTSWIECSWAPRPVAVSGANLMLYTVQDEVRYVAITSWQWTDGCKKNRSWRLHSVAVRLLWHAIPPCYDDSRCIGCCSQSEYPRTGRMLGRVLSLLPLIYSTSKGPADRACDTGRTACLECTLVRAATAGRQFGIWEWRCDPPSRILGVNEHINQWVVLSCEESYRGRANVPCFSSCLCGEGQARQGGDIDGGLRDR